MATVFIPSLMQGLTNGEHRVEIEGATVRQIINNLEASYPGMKDRLVENNRVKSNISVAIDGEVREDANRLDARIEELIYQGDTTRIRLRLACGVDDFVVKLTNTRRQELLPVDAPVSVVFSAEDCRALDEP